MGRALASVLTGDAAPIDFPKLTAEEARTTYPELWLTAEHHFPELDPERLALLVSLATQICPYCHAAPSSCQCWNDE
jgi:hypothetical protein